MCFFLPFSADTPAAAAAVMTVGTRMTLYTLVIRISGFLTARHVSMNTLWVSCLRLLLQAAKIEWRHCHRTGPRTLFLRAAHFAQGL